MALDNIEESLKVIVVGDGSVGKTSMLRRFCKGEFSDSYKKTIGAEFMEKDVFIPATASTVKLALWDTAGQEIFNSLTASYYRGSGACVLAYSSIDRDSFFNVRGWKSKVEAQCGPIAMVLCQTKCDLLAQATVTEAEAHGLATELQLPLFRTSTKDNFNVTQLFEFLAQRACTPAQPVPTASTANAPSTASPATTHTGNQAFGGSAAPSQTAAPPASKDDEKRDALRVKMEPKPKEKKPKKSGGCAVV